LPAPETIRQLVQQFAENRAEYRSPRYNEAQLRHEFLDKFFEALGWDVYNKHGYSLDTRDVIVEDSVEIEGHSKNPDYAFKIGRERKFYVEAKKPNVDIKFDYDPAFQLRRYAWNQHLALSVLTDFEEFSLYDCREKPAVGVSPATSRLMYVRYDEYIDRWDEIAGILSKEAVYKGSFDRYVVETRGKKGTTEVDDEFLKDIEEWRKKLALNLALRNADIRNERQLNYAVQMTIDRIIFLRICEDRGIEPTEQLLEMSKVPNIYQNLVSLFTRADTKYNSGLFHFNHGKVESTSADTFTPTLLLDDRVLKELIKGLYYPCPYIFKEIPVEILGQVYEQFLGRVIRLTPAHQAKVEEKPEVRKAGGVYYTPRYIVDYIVANTVGKLLEGKTPDDASALKIVDPACGSGSFLLGAFQYLMDWHENWYINHEPEKWAKGRNPALTLTKDGWQLTTAEKKRILVNNIHGVDIDAQAVEVTKLSLLLKVLEEETGQLSLGFERVLPDLGRNIQCGNSLIGWDYFEGQLVIDEVEKERVNPFDWKQAFPEVFRQGGFDAVIGNPPWGAEFLKKDEVYLKENYEVGKGSTLDSYAVFIERGFVVLSNTGFLGFITPDTFLRKSDLIHLRKFLLTKTSIRELIETGPVFSQVRDTWCLVFTISKSDNHNNPIKHRQISRFIKSAEERLIIFGSEQWTSENEVSQSIWQGKPNMIVGYLPNEEAQDLITKIEAYPRLGELKDCFAISRGEEGSKFNIKSDINGNFFMMIPKDIERFHIDEGVKVNQKTLTQTKVEKIYKHPKIWIIRIQKMRWKQRIVSAFDSRNNSSAMKTLQVITSPQDDVSLLKYLSGILSSKLINFWCVNYLADDMNQSYLSNLPIRTIDFTNPTDVKQHDRMVALVERMLDLHKRTPQTPQEQESLAREIAVTDDAIDRLVYELYGLTEEEIRIVEGS